MKSKYIKVVEIFILIISILFFLQNILVIYIAGYLRECDRIKITDNNREKIVSLMEENFDCYKDIPDINRAKEIERHVLWHDTEITVYYEDGTTYSFYWSFGCEDPFYLYFINECYNVYFRSLEFVIDLIKFVVSFVIIVIAAKKVFDL